MPTALTVNFNETGRILDEGIESMGEQERDQDMTQLRRQLTQALDSLKLLELDLDREAVGRIKAPVSPWAKPGLLLKNLLLLGGGALGVALAIAAVNLGQSSWQALQTLGQWTRISNQAPRTDIATVVVQQIRGVSELTTTIFAMETVVPTSQTRQWGHLVLGRTELLYIGYGEVRAGIDLSQITRDNVQQQGDRLVVTLPPPQILDKKVDVERSRIYDYDRGFLNLGPDTAPQLQTTAQQATLDKIVAAACERGILDDANHKATLAVRELLTNTGLGEIEVHPTVPAQCALAKHPS